MFTVVCFLALTNKFDPAKYREWGRETMVAIERDFHLPGGKLYGEEASDGKPPLHPAFDWGVGVMLSALNAAAAVDGSYRARLAEYVGATRAYWNPAGPIPGFDVLPGPKPADRYYDDNEWMVLSLVDASRVLPSDEALNEAKHAFAFVMSGWDTAKLEGGIYWRESDKASKNTCSNAPAAAAALELYDITRDAAYLEDAKRIYAWTKGHLRDPADGLYWDNIGVDGRVQKTKWSYNSGLMLRDAAELYRITRQRQYADDAKSLQAATIAHWVAPDGALRDDGKFAHLLLENWGRAHRDVPGIPDPRPAIARALEYLHRYGRDRDGRYGNRWDQPAPSAGYPKYNLIDQASVARAFFEASELAGD